jgi:hypothetical protein
VSASKKTKRRSGVAPSSRVARPTRSLRSATRRPASIIYKPLNEVWWCAIHPHGYANWTYLDVTKSNVAELLTRYEGKYWAARGWRIAKLQVTEVI